MRSYDFFSTAQTSDSGQVSILFVFVIINFIDLISVIIELF